MTSNGKEQKKEKGNTTHSGLMMMTYKWIEDKADYSDKIIDTMIIFSCDKPKDSLEVR